MLLGVEKSKAQRKIIECFDNNTRLSELETQAVFSKVKIIFICYYFFQLIQN